MKIFGTDFSMIAKLLSNRSRVQIKVYINIINNNEYFKYKNKFSKEEKTNLIKIEKCLEKNKNNHYKILNEIVQNKKRLMSNDSIDNLDYVI